MYNFVNTSSQSSKPLPRGVLFAWQTAAFVFTAVLGTLLHFTYEWSGRHPLAALFSAVNESTWEHLKLLFFPLLLFTLPEYLCYGKRFPSFLWNRFLSLLIGMAAIVTSFYTYTGIVGTNFLAADIATFLIGILCSCLYLFHRLRKLRTDGTGNAWPVFWGIIGLFTLLILFFLFTFRPPAIALFRDPISGGYGIEGPAD